MDALTSSALSQLANATAATEAPTRPSVILPPPFVAIVDRCQFKLPWDDSEWIDVVSILHASASGRKKKSGR